MASREARPPRKPRRAAAPPRTPPPANAVAAAARDGGARRTKRPRRHAAAATPREQPHTVQGSRPTPPRGAQGAAFDLAPCGAASGRVRTSSKGLRGSAGDDTAPRAMDPAVKPRGGGVGAEVVVADRARTGRRSVGPDLGLPGTRGMVSDELGGIGMERAVPSVGASAGAERGLWMRRGSSLARSLTDGFTRPLAARETGRRAQRRPFRDGPRRSAALQPGGRLIVAAVTPAPAPGPISRRRSGCGGRRCRRADCRRPSAAAAEGRPFPPHKG